MLNGTFEDNKIVQFYVEEAVAKSEEESFNEKLEIARKLIKRGLSLEDVASDTGLDINILNNL